MDLFKLGRALTDKQGEKLKGTFLDESHYDTLITEDADGYDLYGHLLFRFRKNVIPPDILKAGYEAFKGSISLTEGRGISTGSSHKRIRKDGSVGNTTVGNKVFSGAVGYMDPNAMVKYCRKTAFTREYFHKFEAGLPFVELVDKKYAELCPEHYARQMAVARATNRNYVIGDTSFTTVTVNRNFQTAVHKDAGDYPEGFGNLCVYREGTFDGAYFTLPEFRVAVDMQNTDLLFVDVHKWHGNTAFRDCSPDYMRVAFVMYYREYMYQCKQPAEELARVKQDQTGFYRL